MSHVCICQNDKELLIHSNTAGASRPAEPSNYPPEEEHPKDIVKELHTHRFMGNEALGVQDSKSPFFFAPPELNGNFSYRSFKPAKTTLHEKLKRIPTFKMDTYHLLLMTSVKTEILYFPPLIAISPSSLPIHDKKKEKIVNLVPVQKVLSTSKNQTTPSSN